MEEGVLLGTHPDVVLMGDKDGTYVQIVHDALLDLVERVFGGRRAALLLPELRLVARALYYSCGVVAVGRTVGMEYSDLSFVGRRPGGGLRQISKADILRVCALYAALPYAYDRLTQGWGELGRLRNPLQPIGGYRFPAEDSGDRRASGWARVLSACLRVVAEPQAVLSKVARTGVPGLKQLADLVSRVHRCAFFLDGRFPDFALRLAGVCLAFHQRPSGRRVSYRVLGYLLIFELAVRAAKRAARALPRQAGEGGIKGTGRRATGRADPRAPRTGRRTRVTAAAARSAERRRPARSACRRGSTRAARRAATSSAGSASWVGRSPSRSAPCADRASRRSRSCSWRTGEGEGEGEGWPPASGASCRMTHLI